MSPPRGREQRGGGGLGAEHGPLETPGTFWGALGCPRGWSLPALISLSVWFMMNLSGATQKSLVPCRDETEHGGGRQGAGLPPPHAAAPRRPLTTAAAVSRAMEAQLRTRVRSPQHSILRGEG